MSQVAVAKFIATVQVHFPLPRFVDEQQEDAWMASMRRFLGGYDADILSLASERVLRDRDPKKDGRYFPVPSEVIAICEAVRRDIHAASAQKLLTEGRGDQSPFAGWRSDLANVLVKTEMGRDAAARGWIGSLWDFCRRMARLPERHEVRDVVGEAQAFDLALDACERGEAGACNASLLKLGRSLRERRDELVRGVQQ